MTPKQGSLWTYARDGSLTGPLLVLKATAVDVLVLDMSDDSDLDSDVLRLLKRSTYYGLFEERYKELLE